jgi:Poly(hydroxyalcanoate) granule associated protein (phasin)
MDRQASSSWDKLEQVFEDRVSRSLSRLGMPTQKDFQALAKQVEELSKTVSALSGAKAARKSAAKPKAGTAAHKPAVRASAKKPAKRAS